MLFVEILYNFLIYKNNIKLIENALANQRISKTQASFLKSNNFKEICNHKGLLFYEKGKYFFITRTSVNNKLELPRTFYEHVNYKYLVLKKAEPIKFNEHCNIINQK
jgi:hypothetical protein